MEFQLDALEEALGTLGAVLQERKTRYSLLIVGGSGRIEVRSYGGLELHIDHVPSRFDQVCFNLYAAVDRGPDDKHFRDLHVLRPSSDELMRAARWTVTHNPSAAFRHELTECPGSMGVVMTDADF